MIEEGDMVRINGGPHAGVIGPATGVDNTFPYVGDVQVHHTQLGPAVPVFETVDADRDTIRVFKDGSVWLQSEGGGVCDRGRVDELHVRSRELRNDSGDIVLTAENRDAAQRTLRKIREALGQATLKIERADETSDLKPRGVKRQWHLMPLNALAFALSVRKGQGLNLVERLADYQANPCEVTAAYAFGAQLEALREQQGCTFEQALDLVVQVFEHGAAKYSPDNWRKAATADTAEAFRREYLSGQCRHVFATNGAIDLDHTLPDGTEIKGSGLPHLAHGCCGALMCLWHEMETF